MNESEKIDEIISLGDCVNFFAYKLFLHVNGKLQDVKRIKIFLEDDDVNVKSKYAEDSFNFEEYTAKILYEKVDASYEICRNIYYKSGKQTTYRDLNGLNYGIFADLQ